MRLFLYNLFILIYQAAAFILTPFNKKARAFTYGRLRFWKSLEAKLPSDSRPLAWFHCASLGEFEQGKPVIEAFKKQNPTHKILITFFSPSGYQYQKDYEGADHVCYLPVDYPSNAERFINVINPDIVFFVKYEFWYNYLNHIHKRNIPLYNVSGLFTSKHGFFKANGKLQRKMLGFFNHFFVQDQRSKDLLESINIQNVTISGDTRFDRVLKTIGNPAQFPIVEEFKGSNQLVIIGSSWPEDMVVLFDFINSSKNGIKFLIAPHLVDDAHIKILEKGLKVDHVRITDYNPDTIKKHKVLIVNSIGMLSSLYQYGEMAYIGGAFGDGVHNILEAVAFGLPVVFGDKDLDKFPETLELISLGGAFSISDKAQAEKVLNELLTDPVHLKHASVICKEYVSDKAGATEIIMKHINQS